MQTEYCSMHNINYTKFCNMFYRLEYKSKNNPELYAQLVPLAREYKNSGKVISVFAKEHKISKQHLQEMCTHLRYLDAVEEMKHKEPSKMTFFEIPIKSYADVPPLPAQLPAPTADIIEPQNDIEITITKGVKVCISPNIDSMKIIKIIELLKDL